MSVAISNPTPPPGAPNPRHRQQGDVHATASGGGGVAQNAMQARVVARARFSELARLHRSRHNDAERLERSIKGGDAEELAEAVEECGLREDWRKIREDQCTKRALNEYTSRRQDAVAFEVAAAALLAEHYAQGVSLDQRPSTSGGLPWPLTVGVGRLVEASRARFQAPYAKATGAESSATAAAAAAAAPSAGKAAASAPAASSLTATLAAATAPAPAVSAAVPAKQRPASGKRSSRRTEHASMVLGSLALAWSVRTVLVPRQRVRRTQRREAATTISRYVRLWLRLRTAVANWTAPKGPRPPTHAASAATVQRCWRGHCGRQTAGKMASWANIRARRARRREWESRWRPSHTAAAEIYEQLSVGAWHVAKEQRRIAKERERELRVFEAAFKSWDKHMTRAVMMKPLHDDWVPQMGGTDGKPTSYYNVRTQARVPFHPHVKFVSQNREKGYKKGLATMEERCEPLAAYEQKLLASQQQYQKRGLEELASITG